MASSRLSPVLAVEVASAGGPTRCACRHPKPCSAHQPGDPLWGAARIHGELLKLGIEIAQSTVAKYMVRRRGPPSQGWKIFLCNHSLHIAAIDMFVVPTIGFGLLYGLVLIKFHRRRLAWINATANPTADWIARQITEAFPWDQAPQYLIRDRDASYGHAATRRLAAMGIRDRPTAPRSPWQNGHVERGSSARSEENAWTTSSSWARPILSGSSGLTPITTIAPVPIFSLAKDAPLGRPVQATGSIMTITFLGGLHHQYARTT
jgi:hypothetical protein